MATAAVRVSAVGLPHTPYVEKSGAKIMRNHGTTCIIELIRARRLVSRARFRTAAPDIQVRGGRRPPVLRQARGPGFVRVPPLALEVPPALARRPVPRASRRELLQPGGLHCQGRGQRSCSVCRSHFISALFVTRLRLAPKF